MCAFKIFGKKDNNKPTEQENKETPNEERKPSVGTVEITFPCKREFEAYWELTSEDKKFLEAPIKMVENMPFSGIGAKVVISAYTISKKLLLNPIHYNLITPPWLGRKDWVIKYPGPAKLTTVADFKLPHFSLLAIWGVVAKGKPLADEIWVGVNEYKEVPVPFDRNVYKRSRMARLPVMIFVQDDHVRIKAVTYETGEHLVEEMEFVGMVFYRPYAIDEIREVLEG